MQVELFTTESVKFDRDFLILIPDAIREAFLSLPSDNFDDDKAGQALTAWLVEHLTNKRQPEHYRIIVLRMLVCKAKGRCWLREILCDVLIQPRFEWYFRSLIMSALADYWPREPWMMEIFRKLLENKTEDGFVRTGAESRLSSFWHKEGWLSAYLRDRVTDPKEHCDVQFYAIRSLATYWKDRDWIRATLAFVMFSRKHAEYTREQAAFRLLDVFGPTQWLQALFEKILSDRSEKDARVVFLRVVCENWKEPTWVENHVIEMLCDKRNKLCMRHEVIDLYAKLCSGMKPAPAKALAFLNDKKQNKELRTQLSIKLGTASEVS
jgi:hypothetical protein